MSSLNRSLGHTLSKSGSDWCLLACFNKDVGYPYLESLITVDFSFIRNDVTQNNLRYFAKHTQQNIRRIGRLTVASFIRKQLGSLSSGPSYLDTLTRSTGGPMMM